MSESIDLRLNHRKSTITIAMAQVCGPLPDGKHISVLDEGRETYVWRSLVDMTARIDKAVTVLDFIANKHKDTTIVIFPEYSLPLKQALPLLIQKSKEFNFVIIAGSDNIIQPGSSQIFNQCAVILPESNDPIWINKRELSQWEEGYVDKP